MLAAGMAGLLAVAGIAWTLTKDGAPDVGITVPDGFVAQVFADELGPGRHMAVRPNGDVYLRLLRSVDGASVVALRDEDGDGAADRRTYFHDGAGGTGIAVHDDWLYLSSNAEIYRYRLDAEALVPSGPPQLVVSGFPVFERRLHVSKSFTIDPAGGLFVNVGAPSNACAFEDRAAGARASDPCPLLERSAGLWRFAADETEQDFATDGERYATGIRNVVAIDTHPDTGEVFFVQHGRDILGDLFPELYTAEDNARLPAEELHVAVSGADYGWPYTYWDPQQGRRIRAPEYGGDGERAAESGRYRDPLVAFPAHWAPNALLFFDHERFPKDFQGGAFVAFHGSWNREPFEQQGYNVVFVPFAGDRPSGGWTVFADGFAGEGTIATDSDARYRPTALAQTPDGALLIGDSVEGRIWRVGPKGD